MAWSSLFRRNDESTRYAWGYTFQWTSSHFTPEQLHHLKYSYDVLAGECLDRLDEISTRENGQKKEGSKRDLYALLRDHAAEDEKLSKLWNEVNTIPEWVDWNQIARGQDVFYRYGGAALTALAFQSLLGGTGARRIVETLSRTGGFGVKVARHRMYETTQHILQVTRSLESIKPGGAGHASSVRVRLLHAAVRRRILKLSNERPEYFDIEELGVPINDLDSIATIGTFSAMLIWLGFPRQGIWLRRQEIEDYVAMWRLVAHYVGTPTEYFATVEKAKCIMESIAVSEISPTETSKILANNIISSLQGQPPSYASRDFLVASARWMNGSDLADALGLERPGLYYWALVAGQCIFYCCICYVYRSIPYLDRRKIQALRKIFYAVIVENKTCGLGAETDFDFKYIPDFHIRTKQEGIQENSLPEHGVERRNLRALIIASAVVCIASWYGVRMTLMGVYVLVTHIRNSWNM